MPLQHSSSPSAFKANISTLMKERGVSPHVKDKSQALAIAYSIKNRAKRERGGKVKGYDAGGATDPVTAVISALQSGSNQVAGPASNAGMNSASPTPASFAAAPVATPAGATAPTPTPTQNPAGFNSAPANTGLGSANPAVNQVASGNSFVGAQPTAGIAPQNNMQMVNGMMQANPAGMASGGMAGLGQMPWFAKQEARGLTHTGPIMSAVPGRTDRHNMAVPSGSYVLPAETISHLGQSNTMAGMKIATNMFGAGPMGHGTGAPKPPRMMGIPGDKGGARGEGSGTPVDVVTAGGEFIIDPSVVARIGDGDIKRGHKILDQWVMSLRKDHIRTLKGLKPPVKS
jgi:hypothetical protein